MKLDDDYLDESNSGSNAMAIAVTISVIAIALIVCAVIYTNYKRMAKYVAGVSTEDSGYSSVASIGDVVSASSDGIRVSDLDFYDMYQDEPVEESVSETSGVTNDPEPEVITKENDGKHIKIIDYNGKEEWVTISPYLTKHEYDYINLYNQGGLYKYFEDNKCISSVGVDISKEQGYVDFNKLKKTGVNYVMIRVGQRGYQTGSISEDEYFKDSIKRANDAGLSVGVYFLSQAITKEEAVEEAEYVIENIKGFDVKYPVAFVMQYAANDKARVEALSKNDKSMIARAFLGKIKEAGYIPLLYGDKTWLVKYIDLSKVIGDYDIWLSDTSEDIPEYPYKYTMWRYSESGNVDGIVGKVNLNISFIDYSLK